MDWKRRHFYGGLVLAGRKEGAPHSLEVVKCCFDYCRREKQKEAGRSLSQLPRWPPRRRKPP
jgi:hypothetical protein